MYSSTLPSNSALDGGGWSAPRPGRFTPPPPGRPGTHCTGGWVGPRGRSGRVRKISPPPTGIRSPDRPARSESLNWFNKEISRMAYVHTIRTYSFVLRLIYVKLNWSNFNARLHSDCSNMHNFPPVCLQPATIRPQFLYLFEGLVFKKEYKR